MRFPPAPLSAPLRSSRPRPGRMLSGRLLSGRLLSGRLFCAPLVCAALLSATAISPVARPAWADDHADGSHDHASAPAADLQPTEVLSDGSVTIGGKATDYQAAAGTLVVHPRGWDDTADPDEDGKGAKHAGPKAEASMFYVAYFKKGTHPGARPITFLFNGGPGSSSVWLHMGAFGPRRVRTDDHRHTPAAPYTVVNNDQSLLDVSDLVFIDAPGTGFSRIAGPDKEKSFYGVDQDAWAFSEFIPAFLSKYGRWNSPKYLFGESYGTTRSAVLANMLETDKEIDLNGVILLSEILAFDDSIDGPLLNPGIDQPYILALPSFAATAWYHHRLPSQQGNQKEGQQGGQPGSQPSSQSSSQPGDLAALLQQVEQFATGDYAEALSEGSTLPADRRDAIAGKLHDFTGLPVDYIKKSDLRIDGGQFEKMLQDSTDTTTGRLDSRFSGPSMDPLSREADYDPQGAAIGSAYVSAFNQYVRAQLHYGEGETYKPEIDIEDKWDAKHKPPGADSPQSGPLNVMPDLAAAMKYDPDLKIMLNAGYFDLGTPFFEGLYEMHHLPMPDRLQANIEYKQYRSGHMVYANLPSLRALHDNVADFIRRTDNLPPSAAPATPAAPSGGTKP